MLLTFFYVTSSVSELVRVGRKLRGLHRAMVPRSAGTVRGLEVGAQTTAMFCPRQRSRQIKKRTFQGE